MNKNFKRVSRKNSEDTLVFEKKKQLNKYEQSKVCQCLPLIQIPIFEKVYFIYGDTAISIAQDEEQIFFDAIKIQNLLRPIINIERDKMSQFMRVNMNNEKQGLSDFRLVVNLLQTMQNEQMYQLSLLLEEYQKIVDEDIRTNNNIDPQILIQNKQILGYFKQNIIPQILRQEASQNSQSMMAYGLFECVASINDSRISEYGFNENYLHLIGTDLDTIEQFYLRQGWFSSCGGDSNNLTKLHIQKVIEKFYLRLCHQEQQNEGYNLKFKTLDQLEIQATYNEKTYYIYKNNNIFYSSQLIPEYSQNIIGLFGIMTLDIDPQYLQYLINQRIQNNTLEQYNLLSNFAEKSLSKFQYETQSNYLLQKYYSKKDNQIDQQNNNQDSQCKYKIIK